MSTQIPGGNRRTVTISYVASTAVRKIDLLISNDRVRVCPARIWRSRCAACQSGERALGLRSRFQLPRPAASPGEPAHYRHGGILPYGLRQLLRADEPHKDPTRR
jgi:hypothetical protein